MIHDTKLPYPKQHLYLTHIFHLPCSCLEHLQKEYVTFYFGVRQPLSAADPVLKFFIPKKTTSQILFLTSG